MACSSTPRACSRPSASTCCATSCRCCRMRRRAVPNDVLSAALQRLAARRDLEEDEARDVLLEIMGGRTGEAQTAAEIVGMARAMSALAEKVEVDADVILDTCGTGGDGAHTFNISTAAALVAAGAGVTVAKHGNRSATSRCGSADVLEALPHLLVADRLPCLATVTPAPAATRAAAVEMLNVSAPSPP